MKKIISLFHRNYDTDRLVRDEVTAGAEWVIAGEGTATRKWDGTCCLVRDGRLYKRHELKPGGEPPADFEPATDIDENTGKQQGWVPVGDGPEDWRHREAFTAGLSDGTYELVGPAINGNPERLDQHCLVRHGLQVFVTDPPRTFAGLKSWCDSHRFVEGIVWHHPDGRMVKLKLRDFGIRRQ